MPPISNLLIANRGEIARRILRTAHRLGMRTVAVYADGDARAPFVREADRAVALHGARAADTYLDVDKLLEAARRTGADAIHPGYGFLSENGDFALAVEDAGLVWVGPPSSVVAAMGNKLEAKRRMQAAGVPCLPSAALTPGSDPATLAASIGYPLLVKAAAGGGGRGMRVVHSEAELDGAVSSSRREAAAFGDDSLFLERWVQAARHIEIQILGDHHGHLVHCFERECSIQRRHQKVIEESPSPAVSPELRKQLGEAALAAGRSVDYASAGTVEFLLDARSGEFWFLEMNTRLQVEHPVTELVCGLDLVAEQLRVAQGEPLGPVQSELSLRGHAIEARLYAEDPERGFLPSPGVVAAWTPSPDARFDSGIESGSVIGTAFDPLLAKVIAHAPTRHEAAARLARALETTRLQGLTTNRDFLVACLRHEAFLAGDTTTDFIERVSPTRRRSPSPTELRSAAVAAALHDRARARSHSGPLASLPGGWRNTPMPAQERVYRHREEELLAVCYRETRAGGLEVSVGDYGGQVCVHAVGDDSVDLEIDGERLCWRVLVDGPLRHLHGPEGDLTLTEEPRFPEPVPVAGPDALRSPLPATVLSVEVAVGDRVEAGQLLFVVEAMKMEHRITAPHAGTVSWLAVGPGAQVEAGTRLAEIEGPAPR